ncbi:hypothetical protein CFP56_034002 [Quercus suber]|uniref:Uncharacterized protein n=1 Tax=Quercus suber TaxID=58331 RepID=A0AAW0JDS7_QUESU
MLSSLSQRVGQLEKAFMCDKLRKMKKKGAAGTIIDGLENSPDKKKPEKRYYELGDMNLAYFYRKYYEVIRYWWAAVAILHHGEYWWAEVAILHHGENPVRDICGVQEQIMEKET